MWYIVSDPGNNQQCTGNVIHNTAHGPWTLFGRQPGQQQISADDYHHYILDRKYSRCSKSIRSARVIGVDEWLYIKVYYTRTTTSKWVIYSIHGQCKLYIPPESIRACYTHLRIPVTWYLADGEIHFGFCWLVGRNKARYFLKKGIKRRRKKEIESEKAHRNVSCIQHSTVLIRIWWREKKKLPTRDCIHTICTYSAVLLCHIAGNVEDRRIYCQRHPTALHIPIHST